MQAPTTPSGPPAQEPDERPCAGCGAANTHAAAFCWQCYRPFPAAPGGAPGGWPGTAGSNAPSGWAPSPSTSPFPAQPRSSGIGTMAVVVVATLAVIGTAWFLLFRDGAVAMPDAIGGMPRIDGAQTALVVDTFRTQLDGAGLEGDIVIYGNGTPAAALIWVRDASVPTTDAAFDEFAAGFNEGIGASGSLSTKQTQTAGGVTYVCANVLGSTPGTICMWQDQDVFWLLFDLSGDSLAAGQDLAVAAHEAAQAA